MAPPERRRAVSYFEDAQEVYDTIGKLFTELAADDEMGPRFRKANTIVQYQLRDPDSTITTRLQPDQPGDVDFGESEMDPDVEMSMEADTAHRFWLGKVNVTTALARGQIKASGPVAKILKLVPLTKPVYPRYKAMLEADGRQDLVDID
jgi:putative sterol carrier protein